MATAQAEGATLWYTSTAAKSSPACLVLHGGLGIDHESYRPGLDPLGDRLELVYYDHRCHGRSGDAPLETLTLERLAEDAEAVRAHLGQDRVGLLGHSFGGFIGYEYACRHPDKVAFLIIVCSSPALDYGPALGDRMEALLTDEMREVLALPPPRSSSEWRERQRVLLPLYFHRWRPEYAEALSRGYRWNYPAAVAAGARLAGWDRWQDLPGITAPTLVVVGAEDFIPHADRAPRAVEQLPHGELLVIEECGHYPWLERPAEFFEGVSGWLDRMDLRR